MREGEKQIKWKEYHHSIDYNYIPRVLFSGVADCIHQVVGGQSTKHQAHGVYIGLRLGGNTPVAPLEDIMPDQRTFCESLIPSKMLQLSLMSGLVE